MSSVKPEPQSKTWYDQLALQGKGYPSTTDGVRLGSWSGEDAYLSLVREHLMPDHVGLDAGCGHGDVPLELAASCQHMIAYDRTEPFIELARRNARERGIENVTFICHDSSPDANGGRAALPAEDHSIDIIVSRRGPVHWISDARRVVKSGGVLVQLCMLGRTHVAEWHELLPKPFRRDMWDNPHLPDSMLIPVEKALSEADLRLHSHWTFDVPAWLDDPRTLYDALALGMDPSEIPSFDEVRPAFEDVFNQFGVNGELAMRQRRLLWKAQVP